MEDKRITLRLGGIDKEDGYFRLGSFIQQLQNLSGALKQIDRLTTKRATAYYRVVDLQLSSQGQITLEAVPVEPEIDYTGTICHRLLNEFESLQKTGKPATELDFKTLEALKQLITPLDDKFSSATIEGSGSVVELDKTMQANIDVLIANEETCYGTIKGKLERINLHDRANIFYIYPIVGPRSVECHFPEDLKDQAKGSLEHTVSVSGLMIYKAKSNFPYKIKVEAIEIHPPDDELPTLLDLEGCEVDLTGGLSSEDYVKEARIEQE